MPDGYLCQGTNVFDGTVLQELYEEFGMGKKRVCQPSKSVERFTGT
jgi:hypothetical protein